MVSKQDSSVDLTRRGRPSEHDGGTAAVDTLAEQMGQLARSWETYRDTEELLGEVLTAALNLVPGADEASISVVAPRHRVTPRLSTGPLPTFIDHLQQEIGQGPCVDVVYQQRTVRVSDMSEESRWPVFAARASQTGVASILSIQLYVESDNLGALTLYSRFRDAFTDESEQVGLLLASHAAVALAGSRHMAHLSTALASRDVIGQAKGILMERFKITADQAFALLVKTSTETNRPLRTVADDLASTGLFTHPRTAGLTARAARDRRHSINASP